MLLTETEKTERSDLYYCVDRDRQRDRDREDRKIRFMLLCRQRQTETQRQRRQKDQVSKPSCHTEAGNHVYTH